MTTGFSKIYITLTYLFLHVPLTVCSLLVHSCASRLLLWSILELIGLLNISYVCLLNINMQKGPVTTNKT